jgi:hypothetical protein
MISLLI